ncbi:MAG TPA: DNA-3-methyladenine glycosylase I [Anaerolineales bacterium]|jgi:3-methyladenine DNA glycosylase Tag|nr:DNA-3-methyladenine glycosylase I [Anaerolineales bacterium]
MPELTPLDQIDPASLDDYLKVMSKAVFQSGMSWRVVDSKWPGIQEAFQDFDARKVADFSALEVEALANDKRVIRNRRKLAAIVNNAQKMIELEREHGSFRSYLRSYGDFDATVAALCKDFKFMGPTGCYYFLYVVGEKVPPHEEFRAAYRK